MSEDRYITDFSRMPDYAEYHAPAHRIIICRGKQCAAMASKWHLPVIVIDVLRASSTIITALDHGAREVIPVAKIWEARELAERYGLSLGGERGSRKIKGFRRGNSPFEYMDCKGEVIVLTTTNCTEVVEAATGAPVTLLGAIINARAVADAITMLPHRTIVFAMAGTRGMSSLEDKVGANVIAQLLCGIPVHEDYFPVIKNSPHAQDLIRLGFEKDVRYASRLGISQTVPILRDSAVVPGKKAFVRMM